MSSQVEIPPLPLLDGDTLLIDNSRLETYGICARKGEYQIIRRRIPIEDRAALTFGAALHAALELRYRHVGGGKPTPETEARQMVLLEKWWQKSPTPLGDHRTLGMAMKVVREYNRKYGEETFDLLLLEDRFVVEEPFGLPLGVVQYQTIDQEGALCTKQIKVVWTGRIDLPVKDCDEVFVMDHKTSSMGGDYFMTEFGMSPALMGYCWALRERYKIQVSGAIVNALIVKKPGKTEKAKSNIDFARQKFFFDTERLDEWALNTIIIVQDLVNHHSQNYFPLHNNGKSCVHKYGKCDYFNVCTLSPAQRLSYLYSDDFREDEWTPLHAKAADIDEVLAIPVDALQYSDAEKQPIEPVIDISSLLT